MAAVLAGGLATRLRPITETIPKSLVEVNGEPFVIHQLRMLRGQGVERAVLCIGHLGEQVEAVVGDGREHGVRVEYSFDAAPRWATSGQIFYGNDQTWPVE